MKENLSNNIKYLRKKYGKSQTDIGLQLNKAHTSIGNWEKGISEPSLSEISEIARIFEISPEELLFKDLSSVVNTKKLDVEKKGNFVVEDVVNSVVNEPQKHQKQRLSIVQEEAPVQYKTSRMPKVVTVDSGGNDNIVHVPIKARAGYLLGYGDPAYIEALPSYKLPGLRNGTFRSFEVEGVSMAPTLYPGDMAIGEWVESLDNVRDGRVYIVVTHNMGVVIKRVLNRLQERGKLYLKSDTFEYKEQYPTIEIDPSEVQEIWYSRLRITPQFMAENSSLKRLNDLELDVMELKQKMHL